MKHVNLLFMCLCMLMAVAIHAQHTVRGVVTDDTGIELIGVNILEEGTSNGTTTDFDGTFEITVSDPEASLVFSFIGYDGVTVPVAGESTVEVILSEGVSLNEVQIVGSRSYNRSLTESPVPVDVIDLADLNATNGRVEINQLMQYAAPSFNATKQSGSDGADHIDPASLRGLGPDQTLVLINGKRRHQSSLVNIFGTRGRGNTGTDLNAIPVFAIKRIEVLRDGAAAQYGSDAIAGVINIVLNDQAGLSGAVTRGAYSTAVGEGFAEEAGEPIMNVDGQNRLDGEEKDWDGTTTKVDLNYGVKLGEEGGFMNITTEFMTKDRTLRPGYPWRQGYGSGAVDQFQFMVNAAMPLSDNVSLYAFGGRGDRDTDAYAFTRDAAGPDGDARTVAALYPNGFNPRITSKIIDNSATVGFRTESDNGWKGDFSHTYGSNVFNYFIKNTNNASLGPASPVDFEAGGHSLQMHVTSLDFSKFYDDIAEGLNVAFGTEFRSENFEIFAGQEESWATYDTNGVRITNPAIQVPYVNEFGQTTPGGSQGFPGYRPSNEVNRGRTNFSVYGDVEVNATEAWTATGALRFERYSDFGNTLNFKLASSYKLMDGLTARGSFSTGFRAPSLAQIHYNLEFINIVGGRSLRTLLAPNTSNIARSAGIQELKEETARNYSLGLAYENYGFTATVDFYRIDVDDRIILTDNFSADSLGIENSNLEAVQFFANGVDTRTQGVDIVLNYKKYFENGSRLNLGIMGNFNDTEVKNINSGELDPLLFFSPFSEAYLQAAAPDYKLAGTVGYSTGDFDINITYTQFSAVEILDFQWVDPSTRPTTMEEAEALLASGDATDEYEAAGTLDVSVSYNLSENLRFTVGGNNILNKYPSPQFDGWTDQGGFNDSVQMGSDGAYVFARVGFNF